MAGWWRRVAGGPTGRSDSTRRTGSATVRGWCWRTAPPSIVRPVRDGTHLSGVCCQSWVKDQLLHSFRCNLKNKSGALTLNCLICQTSIVTWSSLYSFNGLTCWSPRSFLLRWSALISSSSTPAVTPFASMTCSGTVYRLFLFLLF